VNGGILSGDQPLHEMKEQWPGNSIEEALKSFSRPFPTFPDIRNEFDSGLIG
jgi:hypothetical protein